MAQVSCPAVRALQERLLAREVAAEVYPYSAFWRARLEAAGLQRGASGAAILRALPPVSLAEIGDPTGLVLRPDERTLQRYAPIGVVARVAWAKLTGRTHRVNSLLIDPLYKPLHWHIEAGVPIGYTAADLDRLAHLGRVVLARAGVGRNDVVLGLLPPGPNLDYWEMVLGCRRAGLSALHLPPVPTPEQVAAAAPDLLIGRAGALGSLLRDLRATGDRRITVRRVIATGRPLDAGALRELAELAGAAVATGAWAPPGVRSLWWTCPGRAEYHTTPDADLVEAHGGELVWTGLGWRGSVLLRLRTGVRAALVEDRCPSCGHQGARVRVEGPAAPAGRAGGGRAGAVATVLDRRPEVALWQAEVRPGPDGARLVVYLSLDPGVGDPVPLLRALDRELHVTQFVVLEADELAARIATHGGARIVEGQAAPGRGRARAAPRRGR
jgi:hypothetical protein